MKAISACLCGVSCTYKGGHHEVVECRKMVEDGEAIAICPEVLGGLSTPRTPAEIFEHQVITKRGDDVTEAFNEGAKQVVALCKEYQVDEVILKSKSPSCGIGLIYDGTFTHNLIDGNGVTAQRLLDEGFHVISECDFIERDRKNKDE